MAVTPYGRDYLYAGLADLVADGDDKSRRHRDLWTMSSTRSSTYRAAALYDKHHESHPSRRRSAAFHRPTARLPFLTPPPRRSCANIGVILWRTDATLTTDAPTQT